RLARQACRNVAAPERAAAAKYPAAALSRDVLHRGNPALAVVIRGRDVDLHALGVHRAARERHVVFPAEQRTDAPAGRVHSLQPARVAETPDHAFGTGRHYFAVTIEQHTVRTDRDDGVVQRVAAEVGVAFLDAAHDRDPVLPGG